MIGFASSTRVYREWFAEVLAGGRALGSQPEEGMEAEAGGRQPEVEMEAELRAETASRGWKRISYPNITGKDRARTLVGDGRLLGVPVEGGSSALKRRGCRDVMISEHGRWRDVHLGTLQALYGKTPYFPYLFPEIEKIYMEKGEGRLEDFNIAIHELIVRWLGLDDEMLLKSLREADPQLLSRLANERRNRCEAHTRSRRPAAGSADGSRASGGNGFARVGDDGFNEENSILEVLFRLGREGIFVLTGY
ncbi:MAG: WbqC family protein [Muribaculaceae bacterium]|nr:WbqC family protein [Muribaculaceae bacterium]